MQVYCIFLFLSAAFLFGILVSQINEIVAGQQAMSKELDEILDAYFSIQPRCRFEYQSMSDWKWVNIRLSPFSYEKTYWTYFKAGGCYFLLACIVSSSLDITTMFKIRDWERFKFLIHHENQQEINFFAICLTCSSCAAHIWYCSKKIFSQEIFQKISNYPLPKE